ncbi:hypothetical protein EVAR_57608_1 [Eumeta japonica]|uniref:Uncharacterized protein n=1 Tax=Eumeta variegata TaxID=151549 RepID=A0A4C1Y0F4_EUMVA|nr:hypothetical protein EVAR_57608_1 [Eumeta japonica]
MDRSYRRIPHLQLNVFSEAWTVAIAGSHTGSLTYSRGMAVAIAGSHTYSNVFSEAWTAAIAGSHTYSLTYSPRHGPSILPWSRLHPVLPGLKAVPSTIDRLPLLGGWDSSRSRLGATDGCRGHVVTNAGPVIDEGRVV